MVRISCPECQGAGCEGDGDRYCYLCNGERTVAACEECGGACADLGSLHYVEGCGSCNGSGVDINAIAAFTSLIAMEPAIERRPMGLAIAGTAAAELAEMGGAR